MTRTLVVRIALVITVVVWGSLAVSTALTSNKFRESVEFRIEDRMRQAGETVLRLLAQAEGSADADIGALLSAAAQLGRNNRYTVYDESGAAIRPAVPQPQAAAGSGDPPAELVERVLGGEHYATDSASAGEVPALVGLPFEWRGHRYALFVQPFLIPQIRDFEFVRNRLVYSFLAISAILVLAASMYLVRPLRKITEATRRLATGDFSVRLNIRQQDELGMLARSINHMADELGKMESVRREFVANVSHDIRTPLTSIRGFTRILLNDSLSPEERRSYLEIIEKESERLSRLSENLLKLASLDARQYPYKPAPVQLDELLRRTVLALEPLWSEKRLQLDLDLPKTVVTADEDALNQVWTNLLDNSIKFTPAGGTVAIRLERSADKVLVTVSDTGIGMTEEDRRQVFQRFFKADSSRRNAGHGGSGLGLAIAAKMVELHGGRLSCESAVGRGTTMTVELPAKPGRAVAAP
ncbi:ATP-binding protein [Paenibacillus thermoaerophilus]|uniref:histidine kinase n=1 Tax=Paenibacillus thermoaerophilus TaxID=1215385 RepID=A0ABW2V4D5_9BACL|nr:HAMP domain-containing sensor histidine kinase [Paenibacillus thermoaerophilus]TMV18426.1 HAMP domain-containing histidine kinase [Paenibacillus thermoaerophilus]